MRITSVGLHAIFIFITSFTFQDHLDECGGVRIACPHHCGVQNILRSEVGLKRRCEKSKPSVSKDLIYALCNYKDQIDLIRIKYIYIGPGIV